MPLDTALWDDLQRHGVNEAQLRMLLKLLQVQRNGSWTWLYQQGYIGACDLRLTFSSKDFEVQRADDMLLGKEA